MVKLKEAIKKEMRSEYNASLVGVGGTPPAPLSKKQRLTFFIIYILILLGIIIWLFSSGLIKL